MMSISILSIFSIFISIIGCKVVTKNSDLNIVGGEETAAYPGVIRLLVDKNRGRFCTGAIVSESTVLMAGHCVKNSTLEDQVYAEISAKDSKIIPIKSVRIYFWPAVGGLELLNPETTARNLAILEFPRGSFKGPFVKISTKTLQGKTGRIGQPIKIVGFGANKLGSNQGSRTSIGVKRVGSNEIFAINSGYFEIKANIRRDGSSEKAVAAFGDAGAPLFDEEGALIGLAAGIKLTKIIPSKSSSKSVEVPLEMVLDQDGYAVQNLDEASTVSNSFVDLSSYTSRKLLKYAEWTSQQEGGYVDIPGIEVEKEVHLTSEDHSWLEINSKNRSGDWVSLIGGGGPLNSKATLGLQATADCSNGQSTTVASGGATASCSTSPGSSLPATGSPAGGSNPAPTPTSDTPPAPATSDSPAPATSDSPSPAPSDTSTSASPPSSGGSVSGGSFGGLLSRLFGVNVQGGGTGAGPVGFGGLFQPAGSTGGEVGAGSGDCKQVFIFKICK